MNELPSCFLAVLDQKFLFAFQKEELSKQEVSRAQELQDQEYASLQIGSRMQCQSPPDL